MILIVMGVCGSGKTTVGKALSEKLECQFADADEFHPESNKSKMKNGIPLTDEDRLPWLLAMHKEIEKCINAGLNAVYTCSALKKYYRKLLLFGENEKNYEQTQKDGNKIIFIHLKGSKDVILKRIENRRDHFMPVSLVQSQFEVLEELTSEEPHIIVDCTQDKESIIEEVLVKVQRSKVS